MKVKIPRDWLHGVEVPETTADVAADGAVTWNGQAVGFVWKGSRTYSPPVSKGSRIVRYHKEVAEWHGDMRRHAVRPKHRQDSRQAVIQRLIAERLAEQGASGA